VTKLIVRRPPGSTFARSGIERRSTGPVRQFQFIEVPEILVLAVTSVGSGCVRWPRSDRLRRVGFCRSLQAALSPVRASRPRIIVGRMGKDRRTTPWSTLPKRLFFSRPEVDYNHRPTRARLARRWHSGHLVARSSHNRRLGIFAMGAGDEVVSRRNLSITVGYDVPGLEHEASQRS